MVGSLSIDSFWEYISVPWSMDSLKCLTSTHLFTLVRLHYVPWFPFSLSVGYLTSVNGIHQWPVIKWCSIMFDLDTFICVMGHVPVAVCVEHLWAWWHSIYATSLTVPVFMRYQFSWPDSSVLSYIFIHYGDLFHCILYMAMTTCDICILFLFMAIILLRI